MIVLQTESQKEMLQKFGSDGVCVDATHGTNGYDFTLTTLLVVDEFGGGQPVSWCLSTHETEEFLIIFFRKVAENAGRTDPAWLMSDCATQSYNAFCNGNQCTAWKKELKEMH